MSGRRRKRRQGKGGMESRTAAAGPGRRGASSQAGSEQPSRRRVTKEQVVRDLQAMTAFTDQDMNALERLFSVVIDLYHDLEPEVEAQMRADFDAEVMRIVSSITERTEGLANPFLRNSAFLLAKNELFEIIMIDILRYIKHELGRGDVEKVLGETVVARRSLTALFPQVVSSAQAYDKIEFKELQARNEELEREVFALQEAAQAGGNSGGSPANRRRSGGRGGGGGGDSAALRQEVATLRRERDELQRQLAAATAAGSAPSAAPSRSSRGRSSRGRGNTGRGGRRGQSRSAKPASTAPSGNESPAGRGSRGAGSGRGRSTPAPSSSHRGEGGAQSDGDMPRSPVYYPHLSSSLRKGKKPPKQDDDNEAARTMTQQERLAMAEEQRDEKWWFLESESFKRLTAPQPTPAEKAALAKAEEEARKAKRKEKDGSPKFVRKLTLKQLKVLIEEIYVSKQKYDHKCDTAELPYETMEQHVYTYLNQKYGLPSLINGWIDGIVEAVEEFQDSDPDVRCFGKILGCALHEGYLIEFHYNLKKKISQLLFAVLQIENPNVSHQEVSNLFHKRIAGSLTYEEWIYMVEDIYPRPEDQQAVLAQMMECIEVNRDARRAEEEAKAREETKSGRRSATLKARVRRRMTDEEEDENTLPFSDFVRIILNYQLDGHVRFLEDFREVFDEIWRNSGIPKKEKVPGVISDEDFVTLVRVLPRSLPRDKILQMLNIVDPFQKGRITFSQSASVLMAILKDVARQNEAVSLHGDDSYYDGDSQASFSRASDVSEEIDISR